MNLRAGVLTLAVCGTVVAAPGIADGDATDDYPIPNRILKTACTEEKAALSQPGYRKANG
jgi:hypothetical protein